MNFLHWISGAAGRRDRRRREERRRLRRRRQDVDIADESHYYHHEYDPETYWTGGTPYADPYSYRHASPVSTTEQEPRVIFVNPGPEYVTDHDQESEDYGYHRRHRRHHRKRRHERAYSTPPETSSHTSYEYIPDDWYRQQYYPPIPDPEPSYESNRRRRYSYGGEANASSHSRTYSYTTPSPPPVYADMPVVISVSPRSTTNKTWSQKVDTTPIYDTDVQRALEESYAQAERDRIRREQRREERRRRREIERETTGAEADWERQQRHGLYENEVGEERRGGRSRRIAELEAEIQARELQRDLRYRDRERDRDRDSRTGSRRQKSYRSATVGDVDSLAGRLDGFDLRGSTHSPAPASPSSSRQERERYVGSLGGSSWTGRGHDDEAPRGTETEHEDYYLRPRVRFSPAVSYEQDFVRRPRVYYSPADLEDNYHAGEEGYRYG